MHTTPLPKRAYIDQEWFDRELELIFGNTWQFAGFEEDLKDTGDYLTVQCGHQNILVLKDETQSLRAFHNLCRHRGAQLLPNCGKKQYTITCPYHHWAYKLNGELAGIPKQQQEFPQIEKKKLGLHPAAVANWRGMIWVHPSADAPCISTWFNDCENQLGPHQPQRLIEYPDSYYERTVQANWKILVENFIDVYHLSQLHHQTLYMYDHDQAVFDFVGDHFVFWEPIAQAYKEHLDKLIPFKRIQEMDDQQLGSYVSWLFPTIGLIETESSWSTFHLTPLSPTQTKVVIRTKLEPVNTWEYLRMSTRSTAAWNKLMKKEATRLVADSAHPLNSGDIMEEDIYVCEQQQKALKNPLYAVGASAQKGEYGIRGFQQRIQKWMSA
ncbi:MAG: aromatic ring-hydroxylating oxygenase subunit alpha [Flammeovirgaceae bacterium]